MKTIIKCGCRGGKGGCSGIEWKTNKRTINKTTDGFTKKIRPVQTNSYVYSNGTCHSEFGTPLHNDTSFKIS